MTLYEARQLVVELVRAMLVLALLLLNLTGVAAAQESRLVGDGVVAGLSSFCGDLGNPAGTGDHAPCHACRLFAGLDVPPPPGLMLRLPMQVIPVRYTAPVQPETTAAANAAARPRAPPLA